MPSNAAVAIVRVSQHRDGAVSPEEQRQRITAEARRLGKPLAAVFEELDVSGGTPLERRKGIRTAIEMIEHGQADTLIGAYFDRLFRSLKVQAEVIERVERAGGRVLGVDTGVISHGEPAQWLSGTMYGVFAEMTIRTARHRAGEAQRLAIAAGKIPYPRLPVGIERNPDGTGRPTDDEELRAVIVDAFAMRAGTASVSDVRRFMAARGVTLSEMQVRKMLASPLYAGRLVFGELSNSAALEPMVDPETWRRVQERVEQRGRVAKSDRLLARLGVLRCGTCRARLTVNYSGERALYSCAGDACARRVSVGAHLVEPFVVERVQEHVRAVQGHASGESEVRAAGAAADAAQALLDRLVRTYAAAGVADEPSAQAELAAARAERDLTRDEHARLMRLSSSLETVSVDRWDELTLSERRDIVRDAIDVALVAPGHGAVSDRVEIRWRGEPLGE